MNTGLKFSAGLLGLGLIAAFGIRYSAEHPRRSVAQPTELDTLSVAEIEGRRLDVLIEETRVRVATGDRLIRELVAGRTTLAVVAAQFVAINENSPHYREDHERAYPGRTHEERVTRQVANRALREVKDRDKKEQLAKHFVAEFHALYPTAEPLTFEPTLDDDVDFTPPPPAVPVVPVVPPPSVAPGPVPLRKSVPCPPSAAARAHE